MKRIRRFLGISAICLLTGVPGLFGQTVKERLAKATELLQADSQINMPYWDYAW